MSELWGRYQKEFESSYGSIQIAHVYADTWGPIILERREALEELARTAPTAALRDHYLELRRVLDGEIERILSDKAGQAQYLEPAKEAIELKIAETKSRKRESRPLQTKSRLHNWLGWNTKSKLASSAILVALATVALLSASKLLSGNAREPGGTVSPIVPPKKTPEPYVRADIGPSGRTSSTNFPADADLSALASVWSFTAPPRRIEDDDSLCEALLIDIVYPADVRTAASDRGQVVIEPGDQKNQSFLPFATDTEMRCRAAWVRWSQTSAIEKEGEKPRGTRVIFAPENEENLSMGSQNFKRKVLIGSRAYLLKTRVVMTPGKPVEGDACHPTLINATFVSLGDGSSTDNWSNAISNASTSAANQPLREYWIRDGRNGGVHLEWQKKQGGSITSQINDEGQWSIQQDGSQGVERAGCKFIGY